MSKLETLPQYFLRNVNKYGANKVAVTPKRVWYLARVQLARVL